MKTILWTVSLLLVICGCTPKPTEVVSPDGHIRLQFALDDHNRMTYRIDVDDTAFVAPSALGFLAGEGVNLSEGMKVVGTEFSAADETWTQPWGENKSIRNHYNEMAVCLSDEADTKLTLRFRVFDDGVGFRYEYEVAGVDSIFVTDELTSFNMAQDGISWSIPANYETYELLYRTQPLSKTAKSLVLPAGMYPIGTFTSLCSMPVTTSSSVPSPPLHTTRSYFSAFFLTFFMASP